MLPLLLALFTPAAPCALPEPAALVRVADDKGKGQKKEAKKQAKEAKKHEKAQRKEWKEQEKAARHPHASPTWMSPWWGNAPRDRHYVALVPGDPSRVYVFIDDRWVLRRVRDHRQRLDLEGAFRLPAVPPPIPPPSLRLNLHIVLFD